MRTLIRVAGWGFLVLAVLLGLAGLATLPGGGLFFALPYLFLIPAVLFGILGAALLLLSRACSYRKTTP